MRQISNAETVFIHLLVPGYFDSIKYTVDCSYCQRHYKRTLVTRYRYSNKEEAKMFDMIHLEDSKNENGIW